MCDSLRKYIYSNTYCNENGSVVIRIDDVFLVSSRYTICVCACVSRLAEQSPATDCHITLAVPALQWLHKVWPRTKSSHKKSNNYTIFGCFLKLISSIIKKRDYWFGINTAWQVMHVVHYLIIYPSAVRESRTFLTFADIYEVLFS